MKQVALIYLFNPRLHEWILVMVIIIFTYEKHAAGINFTGSYNIEYVVKFNYIQ